MGFWNHFKESSASSQAQNHVDGAVISDVVVLQFATLHLPALVNEPLLARWHPLSFLDSVLEVAHSLAGLDVVGAQLSLFISEEHLGRSRRRLGDQQGHLGAVL